MPAGVAKSTAAAAAASTDLAAAAGEQQPIIVETIPETTGAPLLIFKKLEAEYKLPAAVTKHLLDVLGLETLDDFANLFTDPSEVDSIITSQIPNLDRKVLATSRIRQAWSGVKQARAQDLLVKQKAGVPEDFDELLPQPELDELEQAFWTRYHLRYAPEVEPADLLVSRLSKEMSKRLLTVRSVWQTRTMTHQLSTSRKRRKISENLEFVEREPDVNITQDLQTYLELLHTLCIAYARAGVRAIGDRSTAPESRLSDPADYVEAPLEIMLRYHHRAQTQARLLPPAQALRWLQKRDEDERTLWVEKSRTTAAPFGRIVQEAFERREAVWDTPPPPTGAPRQQQQAAASQSASLGGALPPAVGNARDGGATCPAFQRGQCREPCPQKRSHVCASLLTTGKICGMKNHGADRCFNRKKALALSV